MKQYSNIKLKSAEWYKSIKAIEFTPLEDLELIKVHNKNEKMFFKFLGIFPIKIGEYSENTYTTKSNRSESHTLDYILRNYYNVVYRNLKLYRKAFVKVYPKDGSSYFYFDTNEEAEEFLEDLKEKCGKCQNKLY
jgi:hypothetical protein